MPYGTITLHQHSAMLRVGPPLFTREVGKGKLKASAFLYRLRCRFVGIHKQINNSFCKTLCTLHFALKVHFALCVLHLSMEVDEK